MASTARNVINCRISDDMAAGIAAFQDEIGVPEKSDAIRTLIELGLQKTSDLGGTLRRAGYHQGVWVALKAMNEKLYEVMGKVLNERDVNIDKMLRDFASDT